MLHVYLTVIPCVKCITVGRNKIRCHQERDNLLQAEPTSDGSTLLRGANVTHIFKVDLMLNNKNKASERKN